MTKDTGAATTKGRQTRTRIIETAAELMLTQGVTATTVDEICDVADVGKSQIYYYFDDKSALVRGVIEYQTERVLAGHEPVFDAINSWTDWEMWRDWILENQSSNSFRWGCPLGSLANELADVDDLARHVLNESFDRWERGFALALQQMIDSGQLRADVDVAALATFMLSSLQGGILLCQTRKSEAPLRWALDYAIEHLRSLAV